MSQRYQRGSFTTVPMSGLKGMKHTCQTLFLWMCYHANQDGICWPSIKLLAEECGMSKRSVIYGIEELTKLGFLAKTKRRGAKDAWDSNLYQLILKDIPTPSANYAYPSAKEGGTLVHQLHHPSAPVAHELDSVELNKELNGNFSFEETGKKPRSLREVVSDDPKLGFLMRKVSSR